MNLQTMKRLAASVVLAALSIAAVFPAKAQSSYDWKVYASGFKRPTAIAQPADGTKRLFIVEQDGTIHVFDQGKVIDKPFLNVADKLTAGGNEQGLLGMAFSPDYAKNGTFFVVYTKPNKNPTLARYQVSKDNPNVADAASGKELVTVPHPFENHNGGQLAFGPDGYLYWGIGDGGAGGDPYNNGQNVSTLLGDILRLDVSGEEAVAPKDNPFVNVAKARPELWAIGLRNPWRFSFDMQTGDLYIADVGQNAYEEIDFQPVSSKGGENYGWSIMEANHDFKSGTADKSKFTAPIVEYSHDNGACSVTGGYVYRGKSLPALDGTYLYGDYCSGEMWTLKRDDAGKWVNQPFMKTTWNLTTFGQDADGEIYVADRKSGNIYQLVAKG